MTYEEILLSIRNKIDLWNNVCIAEDELNDVDESLNSGESYDFYHGKVEEHVNNARTILDDVAFFLIEDIKEDIRKAAKQFEE
ncbi:MAG: hypothetical protein IJQ16_03250 [Selenomonadaceae bacterium]|nr:hypothetical protein [Selenomonadaceae bacterium]